MVMLYVYSRSIVTYMTHCHSHDPLSIICNVCRDMEIHVRNIDQPQAIAWFPDPPASGSNEFRDVQSWPQYLWCEP